jgi:hypothetical protein
MPSDAASRGGAVERTALARQRSALSLALVAALMLRHGQPLAVAGGLALAAAATAAYAGRAGPRGLTAATVAAAVAAVLVLLA